jgi:hypothetical protein
VGLVFGTIFFTGDRSGWEYQANEEFLKSPEGQKLKDEFKEHTSGSSSTWGKHSDPRSGGDPAKGRYGKNRNSNRGDKNKKYIPSPNPNKRPKK